MSLPSEYYFVRVNGRTVHNNRNTPDCYVPGEPPEYPETAFDYAEYCLRYDLVRLGWPGAGDLRDHPDVPESTPCYGVLNDRVRNHLRDFKTIAAGAGILMPDRKRAGVIYAGDAKLPYGYFYELPNHPFECAHRVGVRWDLDPASGRPVEYHADDFGVSSRGGWWLWALHHLTAERHRDLIGRINVQRLRRRRPVPDEGASSPPPEPNSRYEG
jgi:hypothetical protein